MQCARTLDFWLSFDGVKAYWSGRATPCISRFTRCIDDRIVANDYAFNVENYNGFMAADIPGHWYLKQARMVTCWSWHEPVVTVWPAWPRWTATALSYALARGRLCLRRVR